MQTITSAKTSINSARPAAGFKKLLNRKVWKPGMINFDLGGGRFDNATELLAEHGVKNYIFDPYNRTPAENEEALAVAGYKSADTVTCFNVLNVINSEQSLRQVIWQAKQALKPGGQAFFTVYQGDATGVGRETKAGYQRNQKTAEYLDIIHEYFATVYLVGGVITAFN